MDIYKQMLYFVFEIQYLYTADIYMYIYNIIRNTIYSNKIYINTI